LVPRHLCHLTISVSIHRSALKISLPELPSVTAIAYDVWVFFFVPSFIQSRDIMCFLYRLQDFKADALLSTIADALPSPQAAVALVAGLNRKGQRCSNSSLMPSGYIDKLPNGTLIFFLQHYL
jgi:hypothetical protein